ncbi:MAG: TetR/AcrR family transcriptional regulator [Sphingomonadales bacterium]|nr:TetR/AcrR family transcriptional regulator [Sphingomonadales bacterium]
MRDATRTRAKILDAAADIVCGEGLAALGVNQIAAKACIGKPLIYRHYGGLDGVVDALRERAGVKNILKLLSGNKDADFVIKTARKLAGNPLALQLLASELSGQKSHKPKNAKRADVDEARMAMMMAAICFVLMRATSKGEWMGLSLDSPNDLAVFEAAAYDLFAKDVS